MALCRLMALRPGQASGAAIRAIAPCRPRRFFVRISNGGRDVCQINREEDTTGRVAFRPCQAIEIKSDTRKSASFRAIAFPSVVQTAVSMRIPCNWPSRAGPLSVGEQHDPRPVAFTKFLIGGEEGGVHRFGQRDVCGIVSREVAAQLPNTANQWRVRITFHGKGCESGEKLISAISPDPLPGNQISKRTHHLDIKQMRNYERLVAPCQIASDGVGQRAVREEFDDHGSVENDSGAGSKLPAPLITTSRLQSA